VGKIFLAAAFYFSDLMLDNCEQKHMYVFVYASAENVEKPVYF